MLLSVFAGVGLALSLVGVYGVVACRVRQQERELGIRLALGATPASIRHGSCGTAPATRHWAWVLGLPVALGLAGLLQAALFGIAPRDPAIFSGCRSRWSSPHRGMCSPRPPCRALIRPDDEME